MTVFEILIVLFGLLVVGLLATIWLQLCVLGTIISDWQARMEMKDSWATELTARKILDTVSRSDISIGSLERALNPNRWKPDTY
jgi:hypothetical protein